MVDRGVDYRSNNARDDDADNADYDGGMLMLIIIVIEMKMLVMSYPACKFHLTELRWRSS